MHTKRGFTLIEILIVIVILAIVSTAALFSFGDFGASREAQVTAEQFASYIKLIRQRAIIEMNTLGISVNPQGYEALRYKEGANWKPLSNKSIFRWQAFPKKVVVSYEKSADPKAPLIIINPSGDMTAFVMYFGTKNDPKATQLLGKHTGETTILQNKNP